MFKRALPYYMSIGMTYEEFWDGDVELARYYREAFRLKRKMREQELWAQGAYFCEAIAACFSGKTEDYHYPAEPRGYFMNEHELSAMKAEKEERRQKQAYEKTKADMELWAARTRKRFEKKGGEGNGR